METFLEGVEVLTTPPLSRMPSAEEAAVLTLTDGTPVVLVRRTATEENGAAVEVNDMVLDACAYVLEYEFDA